MQSEGGYTLIETMTALVILFIVLIPTSQLIGFLFTDGSQQERITATRLAEKEMERCLFSKDFSEKDEIVLVHSRQYRIERKIHLNKQLVEIVISIYKINGEQPMIRLKNYRLVYNE